MKRAVLYLRSSKDRSDVSIDAQRRELRALASTRSLAIVDEFADVVLSGKDDNRPAFQAMLRELKARDRGWSVILTLDTSRIARNQYIAHALRHECKKRGVEIIFEKTPEMDGVAGILLPAVLHAMDEVHSFLSREKGLAGMAENVRRGWRAGGRAPWGFQLEEVPTGAMREGEPVVKTRLVATPDLAVAAAYLKGRAAGSSATVLARELGIVMAASSLVGIEWNALTYAGHTVWNRSTTRAEGGYIGGRKRRPREDWVVQRDTHEAVITDAEAEAIMERLSKPRKTRRRGEAYLFSGILFTPSGAPWHGDSGYYRTGSGHISAPRIEQAVMRTIAQELASERFVTHLVRGARAALPRTEEAEQLLVIEEAIAKAERGVQALTSALEETTARRPILERIEALEADIRAQRGRAARLIEDAQQAQRLREIKPEDVRAMLHSMAETAEGLERGALKDFLAEIIERIEYAPGSPTCEIRFRIPLGGDKVASPRNARPNPTLGALLTVRIPARRAA